MSNLKEILAKNIAELRQSAGMTQLELAEKLNYSDKAVSKWERGESAPDISVLVEIAGIFNVSLDYLIEENHEKSSEKPLRKHTYSRGVITSVSVMLVWLLAVLAFVITVLARDSVGWGWLAFIYAVPVSSIVWLVLNSIWLNRKNNYIIISLLMWSVLASIHLSLLPFGIHAGLLYVLGVPGQLIILLWSLMKKRSK